MKTHDSSSIDTEPELPGPSPDIGTYRTTDGRTVIYDERIADAWISSTYSVSIADAD